MLYKSLLVLLGFAASLSFTGKHHVSAGPIKTSVDVLKSVLAEVKAFIGRLSAITMYSVSEGIKNTTTVLSHDINGTRIMIKGGIDGILGAFMPKPANTTEKPAS